MIPHTTSKARRCTQTHRKRIGRSQRRTRTKIMSVQVGCYATAYKVQRGQMLNIPRSHPFDCCIGMTVYKKYCNTSMLPPLLSSDYITPDSNKHEIYYLQTEAWIGPHTVVDSLYHINPSNQYLASACTDIWPNRVVALASNINVDESEVNEINEWASIIYMLHHALFGLLVSRRTNNLHQSEVLWRNWCMMTSSRQPTMYKPLACVDTLSTMHG